ncbi:MAG: hypothetical protein ACOYBY_02640 [Dermatophilaceae bacterium]
MLYHIRVAGGVPDGAILDFGDVVVVPSATASVISCRVPDSAALTGLVAYLDNLGCRILDLHVIEENDSTTL